MASKSSRIESLHPLVVDHALALADVGVDRVEVAVSLVDVESVAHDEVRRDRKAHVLERLLNALLALFEQAARRPRGWPGCARPGTGAGS